MKAIITGISADLKLKLVPKTVNTTALSDLLAARFLHRLVKTVLVTSRELRRRRIYAYVVRIYRTCKMKVKSKWIVSQYPMPLETREPQKAILRTEVRTDTYLSQGDIVRVVDLRTSSKVLKPIQYNAAYGGEEVRAETNPPEENVG